MTLETIKAALEQLPQQQQDLFQSIAATKDHKRNSSLKANNLDEISRLRQSLNRLEVTDKLLRPFKGLPVMAYGFFPGGNGLHRGIELTELPIIETLVLGSNFGRERDFVDDQDQLKCIDERCGSTWRPLLENFEESGINKEKCFFTNAWPFLHKKDPEDNKDSSSGPVDKWLKNELLMESCLTFFSETLTIFQPKLIVALGIGPAAFLGHFSSKKLDNWKGYSISSLDSLPLEAIRFLGKDTLCVAVTHPSMPNAWRRKPPYNHRDGEVKLLKEAQVKANIKTV